MNPSISFLLTSFICIESIMCQTDDMIIVETGDEFEYIYITAPPYNISVQGQTGFTFSIRAKNDAHIALSKSYEYWTMESYELVIGGWANKKSVIRKCDQCNPKVSKTHDPLDEFQFRQFWISWDNSTLRMGRGSIPLVDEFLSWYDPDPHEVNHVGISTGWKANGTWVFNFLDGNWSAWNAWTACSQTCGGGSQTRIRSCDNPAPLYGSDCVGDANETQSCNTNPCPLDGKWGTWQTWSSCTVSCGTGERSRLRACDNPAPKHEGLSCPGLGRNDEECNDFPCPVHGSWGTWTDWGACSTTCGSGFTSRSRNCNNPPPEYGGDVCPGNNTDRQRCVVGSCPVDGEWSVWNEWSFCSHTCGGGRQTRERRCDDPSPAFGGKRCQGEPSEGRNCNEQPCPVNGQWSDWSAWGKCSETCGDGTETRRRTCDNPPPQYGGDPCQGEATDRQPCSAGSCEIDGGWSAWGPWDDCAKTCGDATRMRKRLCDNPEPKFGGKPCTGPYIETGSCNIGKCPVNGGWSEWREWSPCEPSCGDGETYRTRVCNNPLPSFGGVNCTGSGIEVTSCFITFCPVDGSWGEWGTWGACSPSCGTGTQSRARNCTDPEPAFGGLPCLGGDSMSESCFVGPCPIDGQWSVWSLWTSCSATCGGGFTLRTRQCSSPEPQYGGQNCTGSGKQNRTCSYNECSEAKQSKTAIEEPTEAAGAVGIGIIGLGFCAALMAAIVIIDLATVHRHFYILKRNLQDFCERFGGSEDRERERSKRRRKSRKHRKSKYMKRGPSTMSEENNLAVCEERSYSNTIDTENVEFKIDNADPGNTLVNGNVYPKPRGRKPMHFNIEINFNSMERKHLESKFTNMQLAATKL